MARATAGGQVGVNGDFYRGGEFLPSTDAAKGTWRREQAKIQKEMARKVQVAFGEWTTRPSLDVKAIFSLAGVYANFNGATPVAIAAACEYAKVDASKVQAWLDRWIAGERWMPATESLR